MYKDVVLIDSTYRTNKYKMPLLVIAGINKFGKTFLLGFEVVSSEESKNVHWVLNTLFEFFGQQPDIVCTDSCPTLAKVIKEVIPNTLHLLCGWHVSQNIKKHLSGISKFHIIISR